MELRIRDNTVSNDRVLGKVGLSSKNSKSNALYFVQKIIMQILIMCLWKAPCTHRPWQWRQVKHIKMKGKLLQLIASLIPTICTITLCEVPTLLLWYDPHNPWYVQNSNIIIISKSCDHSRHKLPPVQCTRLTSHALIAAAARVLVPRSLHPRGSV